MTELSIGEHVMRKGTQLTRRQFMAGSTVAAVAPYVIARHSSANVAKSTAANDKIQVALIGANGQGNWNLANLLKEPDCRVIAVCEVWKERLESTLAKVPGARGHHDFREVLTRKDIDAVLIATTPHWHAYMAVAAAEAGKDFYLEKPMSLYPAESLAIKRAVEKHKVITQIGTQIHSTPHYHRMVDLVRSGLLGKISVVRTHNVQNLGPEGIGNPVVGDPPPGLDVDMWCGPAPLWYHPLLVKNASLHCSFMNYTNGWTPGMAPHIIDLPYWALDLPVPSRISASGGRYILEDCGDCYDTHEVLWQYPNMTMTWTTSLVNGYGFELKEPGGARRPLGIRFHGVDGTLVTDYTEHKLVPEGDRMPANPDWPKVVPDSPGHHREWLDGIRTRKPPCCHVGYHYKIDLAITLSVLALKLGRSIQFDPQTEKTVGDEEAVKKSVPTYRSPWRFPAHYA